MRDFGQVSHRFWTSRTIRACSDDAKLLALYLMTCSHNNLAGMFRLPDGYICEDTGWTPERVSEGFQELFRNGFAQRCESTKWVVIFNHLEWNPPQNPNQWKAVNKTIAAVPDGCSWKSKKGETEKKGKGLGTVSETVLYPYPYPSLGGVGEKKPKKGKPVETPMPEDFAISDRVLKWAAEKGHTGTLELHFEAFVSTCRAKGYRYVDWDEAFMTAVRKNWARITPTQDGAKRLAL